MIFHPRLGRHVRLHYARHAAASMPHHGKVGVVRIVSVGPGPRNVGVEIDGQLIVLPRGNLVAVDSQGVRTNSNDGSSTVAKRADWYYHRPG